jgi:integrase
MDCRCPGTWFVQFPVWDDGKTLRLGVRVPGARLKRWKAGSNFELAKNQESEYRHDLVHGLIKSDHVKVVVPMRFKEWAKAYVELEEVRAIDTYRERCQRIDKVLMPFFGDTLLRDITFQDVEAWRKQRSANRAQATVNVDHTILRHMLRQAMKRGLVEKNVASQVAAPKPKNARNRVLEPAEWDRLYGAAPDWFKPVLLTGYHTGMRLEEILTLTWERVDLEQNRLVLPWALTKTEKGRVVPLTPRLRQELLALRDHGGVTRIQGLVFRKNGRKITHSYRVVGKLCMEQHIPNFIFHDLRHCAVTNLADAGVDVETIMKIVGHTSIEMFLRYRTIKAEVLDAAMLKLDTRLTPSLATTL